MKVLTATDFSAASKVACRAAARLSAKLGATLHVVHVAHLPGTSVGTAPMPVGLSGDELMRRRKLLDALADELRRLGAKVELELLEGFPDERLLERADELSPEVLVIGPRGERKLGDWDLGSVAMRVVKGARVPVIVVREEESIAAWCSGSRPLRVLVGTDPSKPSQPEIDWLGEWNGVAPIELCAAHVYTPGAERTRAAIGERETSLASEVRLRFERAPEFTHSRVRVLAGFGRIAEHVLDLAAAEHSDLVVVGTHRRALVGRWLHGSVSLDIVASAKCNVATVPLAEAPPREIPREIRHILVPTDLSELSARAVAWAASLLPRGGTLQLVHVLTPAIAAAIDFGTYVPLPPPPPEELEKERADTLRQMRASVPADALARGVTVHAELVEGFNSADLIARAAERLHADVICLSTHGRSGLSKAILGSVAEGVVRHARVPVLIVPPHWRS